MHTLTIQRVPAVAPTFYLCGAPGPKAAPLVAEICERLEELEELKLCSSAQLLHRLAALSRFPVAYRLTLELLHGNTEALTSFGEQAAKRGVTKQMVHLEFHAATEKIKVQFPELVSQLHAMRTSALAHEDPLSRDDALRTLAGASNGE